MSSNDRDVTILSKLISVTVTSVSASTGENMVLRGHRCFPIKCCCWVVAMIIALLGPATNSQDYCTKETPNGCPQQQNVYHKADVTVLTIGTSDTHGLQRYLRSAEIYGIDVEVLGKGDTWKGGDMNYPGGGQKVNLLRNKLNKLMESGEKDKIILFTDSYDVMFLASIEDILDKFKAFPDTRVLFSAEPFCWPDAKLAVEYPKTEVPNPYLNSGGFIGYLPELLEIVNHKKVNNIDDDQLFYTKVFLNKELRESLKMSLDYNAEIFQNLNGALSDVQLRTNNTVWPFIENTVTRTKPLIVHGNGPAKLALNNFGNFLAKAWSSELGCTLCEEKKLDWEALEKKNNIPTVMLAVFIEQATPFMEEFFQQLIDIDYPKGKIHLFLRNNIDYHEKAVEEFLKQHSKDFATVKRVKPSDFITEPEAREIALTRCMNSVCEYLFSIDSISRVKSDTLRYLVTSGYDVITPMLVRPGKAWSNFWGAVNTKGYYARSNEYMDIVEYKINGIWNVPFITGCYLMKMSFFREPFAKGVTYYAKDTDADMAFCQSLRNLGIFMHVSNEQDFGHLVNPESFDVTRVHPDVYQVIDNKLEWEQRYLNKEYPDNFIDGRNHSMPCPDVYWFPLMTDRFCQEWIDVMEDFGQWSDGSNYDNRLQGGYEAVPTRDIHMTQVGLDKQWLYILKEYVRPLQEMIFTGYYHNPPRSDMNFVVRYRPDEQPSLRPHHDSSTYTINLALNTPQLDYEGGGCHFIRYNCSVRNTKRGWLLMHPGRLTHYHEGLLVTKGTRYIMISFVDP